jgi:hypothetical protein
MRFTDYPRHLSAELYEQATRAYAELIAQRVHALYQTGSITHPGISDLDLIVVPVRPRYDNYAYFSITRLPERLRSVFRHPPFVLPLEARRVVYYTSHLQPRLVHGRDVLPAEPYQALREDRWSMLLEDYCRYHRFVENSIRSDTVSVRFLLSKLGSVRIPLRTLDALAASLGEPGTACDDVLQQGEELRAAWFENGASPQLRAAEAWALLCQLCGRMQRRLRGVLQLREDEDLPEFTRRFLRGERSIPGVDVAAVWRRQLAVRRYYHSLCPLGIQYEPLVPNTLFVDEVRAAWARHWPSFPVRAVVKLEYKLDYALRRLRLFGGRTPAAAELATD